MEKKELLARENQDDSQAEIPPRNDNEDAVLKTLYSMFKRELIGSGSFGDVYKMRHKKFGTTFAVKVLNGPLFEEKDSELYQLMKNYLPKNLYSQFADRLKEIEEVQFIQSAQNEVNLLQSLDHDHIVKTYGFKKINTSYYIFMEYCPYTLQRLLKDLPGKLLPEDEAARLFYELVKAVEYLHGKHSFCVTPYYRAPEVLEQHYGFSIDIWSLGVILFEMTQGRMPFEGRTHDDLSKNIRMNQRRGFWSSTSNDLQNLLSQLLRHKQSERITIGEILRHPWLANNYKFGSLFSLSCKESNLMVALMNSMKFQECEKNSQQSQQQFSIVAPRSNKTVQNERQYSFADEKVQVPVFAPVPQKELVLQRIIRPPRPIKTTKLTQHV